MERIWNGWKTGELQIHFIHTGVGESVFYIFPDGTTMLCDCGDHPAVTRLNLAVPVVPGPERLAGDWVARYIGRVLPPGRETRNGRPVIDYMVLSHYHEDHCGSVRWQTVQRECKGIPGCYRSGLELVAEHFAFDRAVDRAWPNYCAPQPVFPEMELDHMKRLYAALQIRDGLKIERFRLGATDQIVPMHAPEQLADFCIKGITANGCILCRDGHVEDLLAEHFRHGGDLNENSTSLGWILSYGNFRFYSCGDFSAKVYGTDGKLHEIEDRLADELEEVDAAKINHHGHHSMPEKIVKALAARAWFSGVWDQLHWTPDVLARLSDRTIYPGDRTFFPGVFPKERFAEPNTEDFAPETKGRGCHSVITVPPGGDSFRVTCIAAEDESMRITGEYEFKTSRFQKSMASGFEK